MSNFFQKFFSLITLFVLFFSFSACSNNGFSFVTDIIDNSTVTESTYAFSASAMYGNKLCNLKVSVNGANLSKRDFGYVAQLNIGKNIISMSAESKGKNEIKSYHINYRAEFKFITDIETAGVINEILSFTASAFFNDIPCQMVVQYNGNLINGEKNIYNISLKKGENKIEFIARSANHSELKEWSVLYEGFSIVTDLKDLDTVQQNFTFRLGAAYGDNLCELEIRANNEIVTKQDNEYRLNLKVGDTIIQIFAKHGNMSKSLTFVVRFVDAPPTLQTSIEDNHIYRGSIFNFDVIAKDGLGKKLDFKTVSFAADFIGNGKFINLSSTDVQKVWDDSTMTSFRINFQKGAFVGCEKKEIFSLMITAKDSFDKSVSVKYNLGYQKVNQCELIGKVVFALEGFTISKGYFVEPTYVDIYEGEPFSKALTEIITERGWTYVHTGSLESSFYLAAIHGLDLSGNRIAEGIWDFITQKELTYQCSLSGSTLGEFDFGSGSGWMFSTNGIYKNYGFADYFPQDGDTVRVQFTLILGEDLGGGGALGGSSSGSILNENPDYTPIMKLLAEVNNSDRNKIIYNEVLKSVSIWNITEAVMNYEILRMKESYGI